MIAKIIVPKNENLFRAKFITLLKDSVWRRNENELKECLDFLIFASYEEAHFYSMVFEDVKSMSSLLKKYSDDNFSKLEKRSFYKIVIKVRNVSGFFYTMLRKLSKNSFGEKYSHMTVGEIVDYWFIKKNKKILPVSPRLKKTKKTFIKLTKDFMSKGFDREISENLGRGLVELDDLVYLYRESYRSFLKSNNVIKSHQKFRDLNYAMHCLMAYGSRWSSILIGLTSDKRY